ncbi:MAG: recombinase family protein [Dehalococcoidia bacterium]|nr:recombinase family protein [Dehalococcoidia bacterium]
MKVCLYARVSSDKQDTDLSISAQLKALREYATRNGYHVVREFVDEAESGRTAARPAFREMVSLARRPQKPFDAILVWKYSRFARSREDSIVYKTMLRKNGVQVVSINEPFEDTPTGRLFEAMIESLDEFYSANLGEEITRGLRESASRGFYMHSRPPYGYRRIMVRDGNKERPRLEIEPHQAPIVATIFNGVIEGKGLKEIVKELNQNGVAGPKGKTWGKTTLYKILTNEAYTGTLTWGRTSKRNLEPVRVENAWPAIVDRETFAAIQGKLSGRAPARSNPRRLASRYLLSGLAKCGYCGKALVGQEAKGGRFNYYVCGTLLKKGAGSCQARYLNSRKFEEIVVDKIKEHILTEENLRELVRLVNEDMDSAVVNYREELDNVSDGITSLNNRLEKLYDALETGKIGLDDLAPRIQQLRHRQEQFQSRKWELEALLSDRRVELADLETVTRCVDDLRNLLAESSLTEKKAFVRSFVREVKVTSDEVLLTYTMPLPPQGISEERMGVLCSVHSSGGCLLFVSKT